MRDVVDGADALLAWLQVNAFTVPAAVQTALLTVIVLLALWGHRRSAPLVEAAIGRVRTAALRIPLIRLRPVVGPALAALATWLAYGISIAADSPGGLLRVAANLLTAWVAIRLLTGFLRQPGWAAFVSALVWLVAALAIVGLLEPLYALLDRVDFTAGDLRITVLGLVNGLLLLIAFLWASSLLARFIDDRMAHLEGVSAAARVLLVKVLRIVLFVAAVLVALASIGIDLTAIAIFSGAVGVGLGFGLQKIVSNLISGIALLLDRSLKPGDVIEIGDAYGWIRHMGARYITVATRDGKEYLVPNEDIVTQQVINWSYSDSAVRLKIGVGVSYRSDLRTAMALINDAALAQPRVLRDDEHRPQVRLTGFGDSSVELELRVWIQDPAQGVVNVASDIRLALWDAFHAGGVEFPFPQRDVHIVSAAGLAGSSREPPP